MLSHRRSGRACTARCASNQYCTVSVVMTPLGWIEYPSAVGLMEWWVIWEEIGGGGKNTGNWLEGLLVVVVVLCLATLASLLFSVAAGTFSNSSFCIAFLSLCGETWREAVREERRLDTEEEDRLVDLEEGCDRSRSILS